MAHVATSFVTVLAADSKKDNVSAVVSVVTALPVRSTAEMTSCTLDRLGVAATPETPAPALGFASKAFAASPMTFGATAAASLTMTPSTSTGFGGTRASFGFGTRASPLYASTTSATLAEANYEHELANHELFLIWLLFKVYSKKGLLLEL